MHRSASATRAFYEQEFKVSVLSSPHVVATATATAAVPNPLNMVNKLAGSVTSLAGLHNSNDHLLQLPISCNNSNKKMMMHQNHKVSLLSGENSIHFIPIILFFCGFLLWLNSHPVVLV